MAVGSRRHGGRLATGTVTPLGGSAWRLETAATGEAGDREGHATGEEERIGLPNFCEGSCSLAGGVAAGRRGATVPYPLIS